MGYYSVTVKPTIPVPATAFSNDDLLFDWVSFEIPKGTAKLVHVGATIIGTNTGSGNEHPMDMYFAKSINGVAPATLGTCNAAITKANAVLSRQNMLSGARWNASGMADTGSALGAGQYNVYGGPLDTAGANLDIPNYPIVQGEGSDIVGGTTGYQTIYVAASAQGAFDFGSAMLVDNGAGYAAGELGTINLDGQAGDILFAPGEELQAQDGAILGEVHTISDDGSHTSLVIKGGLVEAIADGDEISLRYPIVFNLGFEY
jgi:hypothetical protein|tara:strand:+ start:1735 stop:2514 length:780 start_codon:yes stop_codon:yes gene_type:complete